MPVGHLYITITERPWFKPAFVVLWVLVRLRVVSVPAAAKFLATKCMRMKLGGK
jgi:hypothetical protein